MARLRLGKPLTRRGWAIAALVLVGGIGILYAWNPQKVELFAKGPPRQSPVTVDEVGLFERGKRVVVVVAHPDDPEFYISGTLLKLKASGARILIVLTTDGGKAYYPPFTTNVEENRRVRREEQIEAARAYDAEVAFLDGPDGRYVPDDRERAKLANALSEFRPEIVITFDGEYPPTVQHRDHRNAGIAAEAVVPGTGIRWLLRFGTRAPNLSVDTTGLWEERARLLTIHRSQFNGARLPQIQKMVRSRAEDAGRAAGFAMAEPFRASAVR